MTRALISLLATAACLAVPALAGAWPGVPAADIASLNALRAANGIPAGIVEAPSWLAACHGHRR